MPLDPHFYWDADRFFRSRLPLCLSYDDVSLVTQYSEVLPRDTDLRVELAPGVRLNLPILSSDMDTVTEAAMAQAMALEGGMGVIHPNLPLARQVEDVRRVKSHYSALSAADKTAFPRVALDASGRLLCGVSLGLVRKGDGSVDTHSLCEQAEALQEVGADVMGISTAHGHSRGVGEAIQALRAAFPDLPLMAGNITSAEAVSYLADCGANILKVGQGPGSICTTRIVAGVGTPQLSALYFALQGVKGRAISLIADGGINKSGDIVKALSLAHVVMCGSLLAGCEEAPGATVEHNGKPYKAYRGMGSHGAMAAGSASRYGHLQAQEPVGSSFQKKTAEGVSGLKPLCGPVSAILAKLRGGIEAGMGYLGAKTLHDLRHKARYVQVSPAGQREAGVHDVYVP